jgi:hypothetical protein
MLLVVGIVLSHQLHAQARGKQLRRPGLRPQNEFNGCRRDQREWSDAMTPFDA